MHTRQLFLFTFHVKETQLGVLRSTLFSISQTSSPRILTLLFLKTERVDVYVRKVSAHLPFCTFGEFSLPNS